jgi:hypothetical protein
MITFKDWLAAVDYRITETSDYGWSCYGEHAQVFTYWDNSHTGVSTDIIYDLKTEVVYEVTAHDFAMSKSYRMINPTYRKKYLAEVKERDQDDWAYDDVAYVDLETDEDLKDKLTKILNYEIYDTRVEVPLDLNRDQIYVMMEEAHKQDMTLNQYVEHLLRQAIDKVEPKKKNIKKRIKK